MLLYTLSVHRLCRECNNEISTGLGIYSMCYIKYYIEHDYHYLQNCSDCCKIYSKVNREKSKQTKEILKLRVEHYFNLRNK